MTSRVLKKSQDQFRFRNFYTTGIFGRRRSQCTYDSLQEKATKKKTITYVRSTIKGRVRWRPWNSRYLPYMPL